MKTAALILVLLLQACTAVSFTGEDGRRVFVWDVRLAGSAVNIEIIKPDGTTLKATRDQESPEDTITAVGEAAADIINPARGLTP
jgi:hypothetical protein